MLAPMRREAGRVTRRAMSPFGNIRVVVNESNLWAGGGAPNSDDDASGKDESDGACRGKRR